MIKKRVNSQSGIQRTQWYHSTSLLFKQKSRDVFWFELVLFSFGRDRQFYSVVTLPRLQWLRVEGISPWWLSSAFRSGERSTSTASSRRANCQSRFVLLGGVMLKTRMRRWEAIWRHTPVQYHVRSRIERIMAIQRTTCSSMKLLKYWLRKRRMGPIKAVSGRCNSLLVMCAITSLLEILAITKPNVSRYRQG